MHLISNQIFTMTSCEAPINAHPAPISVQQYSNLVTSADRCELGLRKSLKMRRRLCY